MTTRPRIRTFARQFAWGIFAIASWVPVAILVKTSIADIVTITGPSMYPFLNSNPNLSLKRDRCLVVRYNARQNLKRGMVVTMLQPHNPEKWSVKRVVALEGDIVKTRPSFHQDSVVVPAGHVWVEGDASENSYDSNHFGPISTKLIVGRLTHFVFPFEKVGKIRWWEHYRPGVYPTRGQ